MFDMLVVEEGLRRSFSRIRAIRLRIGALGRVEPAALYSCVPHQSPRGRRRLASQVRAPFPAQAGSSRTL
jgi:hypothetical protein